jgi:hypothetical protein
VPVGVRAPLLGPSSGRMDSTEEVIVESPSGSLGSSRSLLMAVTPKFVVCSKEDEAGAHVDMERYRYRGPTVLSRLHCIDLRE